MSNIYQRSLELHKNNGGKLAIQSKVALETKDDLSLAYSPGVAEPCRVIAADPAAAYDVSIKGNAVAIVSDGSAVLGLGNIGAAASLPVMEGKALLLKRFADIDAYPIVLDTQDTDEIIRTVRAIAPGFAGINLEDISAPRCFAIEEALQDLGIPVFHDDQHGTAIVTRAGLLNAAKVVSKDVNSLKVVVSGAGAAGVAITKFILDDVADVVVCDSRGIISQGREGLNESKQWLAEHTNNNNQSGSLADALVDADVFIGVSVKDALGADMVATMADQPIVFAMANPDPEIDYETAQTTKIAVYATGRSDLPNQVNNVLAFPAIFRFALDQRIPAITTEHKIALSNILAGLVAEPTTTMIVPNALEGELVETLVAEMKRLG